MDADQIRGFYVLYIGAGAVAAGGIISMCRTLPLIVASIYAGIRDMRGLGRRRRRRPLSVPTATCRCAVSCLVPWLDRRHLGVPGVRSAGRRRFVDGGDLQWINLVAAVLIVLFGFFFVVVSARLTGEIGSSSQSRFPGMTVATLLLTCLIFLFWWATPQDQLIALSVAAVVCIASSNGGTIAQSLKTGFLVGATPRYQQLAILVGSLSRPWSSALTLLALNSPVPFTRSRPRTFPT